MIWIIYATKYQNTVNVNKIFSTLLFFFLLVNLNAQKFIKVVDFNAKGPETERTYIGSEEKFTDSITGTTVTKINIITETRFEQYKIKDSLWWYNQKYVNDMKSGYFTDYNYLDDSLLVFLQNKLYDNYDASNLAAEQVYMDMLYFDSLPGNKLMQFDMTDVKSMKKEQVIAYFIYDSLKWNDIRTLPLRPFVEQELDTLGKDSIEYQQEIAMPMTYDEIMNLIKPYRNYAIDSLSSKGVDPFQYLAEMTRLKFMRPYYSKNIQKPYIREAVLTNMRQMVSKRIIRFLKFTRYDFRREPAYNNIITFKTIVSHNPKSIDTTKFVQQYYDEYDSLRVRYIPRNPDGKVSVSVSQIQTDALVAAAKNLAYEMDKWYKLNWKRIYGKKELAPDEFVPEE